MKIKESYIEINYLVQFYQIKSENVNWAHLDYLDKSFPTKEEAEGVKESYKKGDGKYCFTDTDLYGEPMSEVEITIEIKPIARKVKVITKTGNWQEVKVEN